MKEQACTTVNFEASTEMRKAAYRLTARLTTFSALEAGEDERRLAAALGYEDGELFDADITALDTLVIQIQRAFGEYDVPVGVFDPDIERAVNRVTNKEEKQQ